MLNVLLSFAQFERELISERTRDNDCRIDAVTFNDIMLDFGASCGEYAMESQAYSIFKRIAELNNVTFTSEPYDGDESLLVVHVDGVEIRDDE
jgi:hypothetical protein